MSTPAADASAAVRMAAVAADVAADGDWRDAARDLLQISDTRRAERFDAGDDIDRLLADRSRTVDAVVCSAWQRCIPATAPLHLLATGGYGRGELFPQSDIDLLVLAEPDAQTIHLAALARLFALLWDAGLAAGHAARSLAQCADAAAADITVLTALSEARLLAGDPAMLPALAAVIASDLPDGRGIWSPQAFFAGKQDEQRRRHQRFHDTAYNLEPNIKEGPGGLRDLHTLLWMARRIHGVASLQALVALGQLGEDEYDSLQRERRALSRLRFGLHLVAGRREERLGFDHQKALADRLGLKDERRDNLAVEQMMQRFFRSAATVLRINERLLQRFEEELEGAGSETAIDADFHAHRGYLALRDPQRMMDSPALVLRLFAVWAEHPHLRGLHSHSARAVAEALPRFPSYAEAGPALHAQFLALLRGPQAVATLSRMAWLGVLGNWLPAFGRVAGRMQFDLFHVYTVDQHTLTVLRHLDSFARPESIERFAHAHAVWATLRKPELLLLAGLFHDIAKGRGGDHSVLGAEDAAAFCATLGLPVADVDLVAWLVREHLLMSVTAQRQDISDLEVVNRFATRVGDRHRLDHLYLLTCADIAGTSPKLWNAWKDRLLADLHTAARYALRRGLEHPLHVTERVIETRQQTREILRAEGLDAARIDAVWRGFPDESFLRYRPEQLAWQTLGLAQLLAGSGGDVDGIGSNGVLVRPHARSNALEVFVYTPDRDGVFAALVATLDRLGLDILEARVLGSADGHALDTFQVISINGEPPPAERIVAALERALLDPAAVWPSRRTIPRHLRHFRVPIQIDFDQLADRARTRLSLVCTDRPGLLADVAQVLRRARLRVHEARIATFGERVEDIFLLSNDLDASITDSGILQSLRAALTDCVDGELFNGKKEGATRRP